MAQRLVRAKAQDPRRRHPVPGAARPPAAGAARPRVLAVLYLVFNEGYSASAGRRRSSARDLCAEAIRLARVLVAAACRTSPRRAGCWR